MMRQDKHNGFTLMEIIVVLAILSLILLIVPPFLPNVMANVYVKDAARELAVGLKQSRSQAIDEQQETVFVINVEKRNYQQNTKTKTLSLPDAAALTLLTAKSEQLSEHEGQIRFFPDGSSTGGQIKLAHNQNEFAVDVNWLTGKVKIVP